MKIKLRSWDPVLKKMFYDREIQNLQFNDKGELVDGSNIITVCTGMYDINGNGIYVDDIIAYDYKKREGSPIYQGNAVVRYCFLGGEFIARSPYTIIKLTTDNIDLYRLKIVGNRHENPDICSKEG